MKAGDAKLKGLMAREIEPMAASCRIEYPTAFSYDPYERGEDDFWQLGNEWAGCLFIASSLVTPNRTKNRFGGEIV